MLAGQVLYRLNHSAGPRHVIFISVLQMGLRRVKSTD
jgi:hypothetical protein